MMSVVSVPVLLSTFLQGAVARDSAFCLGSSTSLIGRLIGDARNHEAVIIVL
jgi:hypothetical protein